LTGRRYLGPSNSRRCAFEDEAFAVIREAIRKEGMVALAARE
jgi:non-homologous end joining protein Ku